MNDIKLHAGFAYAYSGGDVHQLSASSSMRTPEGLSTTLAAGTRFNGSSVSLFFYGKLAYQFDFFLVGATAFGVDATRNRSVGISGDDAINYGIFGVQNFVTVYRYKLGVVSIHICQSKYPSRPKIERPLHVLRLSTSEMSALGRYVELYIAAIMYRTKLCIVPSIRTSGIVVFAGLQA